MKKNNMRAAGVIGLMGLMLALVVSGCASFEANAGKTLASTELSVDAAMKGWARWVAAGQANANQEASVKAAYGKYQASLALAGSAYESLVRTKDQDAWSQAAALLTNCSGQVIALIQSFQGGSGGIGSGTGGGK